MYKINFRLIKYTMIALLAFFSLRNIFSYFNLDFFIYLLITFMILLNLNRIFLIKKVIISKNKIKIFIIIMIFLVIYAFSMAKFGISNTIYSFIPIITFLVTFAFISLSFSKIQFREIFITFIKFIIFFALVNSVLSIYQYFYDPTVFGIVTHRIYSNDILLSNLNVARRTTGLLGSPQNLSLYLGVSLFLILGTFKNNISRFICFILILVAGLLTVSRTFVIFLFCFVLMVLLKTLKNMSFKKIIGISILFVIFIININSITESIGNFPDLYRLILYSNSRVLKLINDNLQNIIDNNLIFGEGYYNVYQGLSLDYSSTESYYVYIFVKNGLIGIISILLIHFDILKNLILKKKITELMLFISLVVNFIFTPSFSGLSMSFIIWFILFGMYIFEYNFNLEGN